MNKKLIFIFLTLNFIFSHSSLNNSNFHNNPTLGDINEDGTINVQDIILIVNIILNNEYDVLADLNEDSEIDILDAVQIIQDELADLL